VTPGGSARYALEDVDEDHPRDDFSRTAHRTLTPGYEASFVVLSGNPLRDFSNVTHITRRVKPGRTLE